MTDSTDTARAGDSLLVGVQHLDLIARKYERLALVMEAAFDQLLAEVRRDEFTGTEALHLWEWARCLPFTGSSTRMADALGVPVAHLALWRTGGAPDDFRSRSGTFPPSWPCLPQRGRPCVYLLLDDNRQVLYVGMSVNVRNRVKDHKRGIHGQRYKFWEVILCKSKAEAVDLEGDLIFQHQPELNIADRYRRRMAK